MKVTFEKVIDGINRYIDKEVYSGLNDLQEFMARLVVGRFNQSMDSLKSALMSNGFLKTLCVIDDEGMVDIDQILNDVRREIERKGSIQLHIPYIGKLTFRPDDVDALHNEIMGR